jgi:glycosyltransferase involved in cell wall biosynthesis
MLFTGGAPDASAAAGCDVVHLHLDRGTAPAAWRCDLPVVATLHAGGHPLEPGSLDGVPLIAVSDSQRVLFPSLPWSATISYGIPADAFGFREGHGGYLVVVGSLCPGDGIDRSIEIARRSGRRIRIAAKTSEADENYFRAEIAPLLADPHVTLVGDLEDGRRNELLRDALRCFNWPGEERILS